MSAAWAVWCVAGVGFAWGLHLTQAPPWAGVLLAAMWVVGAWLACFSRVAPVSSSAAPLPAQPLPISLAESGSESPAGALAESDVQSDGVSEAPPEAPPDALREAEQDALRYALSHDLRAPLRVVDGFTRIVKEDYGRLLDRLGHDHLDRVLGASARMNGMIDAILAQAQLAGAPLARQDVDLSALVLEVAQEQAVVRGALVPVDWVIQPALRAQADAMLLRRVVENLLGNALKYSAKVAAPRIEFGCTPATNPPVFYVRDNGAGFDMQHADKLFGMFQRLHSAKDFEGNGVGLAGVHNIIRRHGGRVWAEAQPGQGACFYFTLMGSAEAQRAAGTRSD
ncbi:MAG: hypothetical protein I8H76_00865 [Burkholderiales bacterium]|nr:hypothetical protein [Burkholderiales bacterium]MBH2017435.1 hypothetical protein [Burkholderiales bacterium]